jgi:hypothetical protein
MGPTTLSIKGLFMTLSIAKLDHYSMCHVLFVVMLSVAMLFTIMLNVVMLSVVAPS